MFDRILSFLKELPGGEAAPRKTFPVEDPRIAAAALMYHVMDADGVRQDAEWEKLKHVLSQAYDVTGRELDEIVVAGGDADDEAVDLYTFTSVLNRHLGEAARIEFVGMMWEIAYADGELDELEDNTLWRISGLLGVDGRARVLERQKARANAPRLPVDDMAEENRDD